MKTIKNSLLISVIASIGLQLYLSLNYYQLHSLKGAGDSICNINKIFNCSAVSASSFSNIAGIPISNIGLSLHLVLLALIVLNIFSPSSSKNRLKISLGLASISLLGSVVMAAVSFMFLNVYCIFCIGLYILSIIIWLLLKKLVPEFKFNIQSFFNKNFILKPLISIAVLSFFSHILLSGPKEDKKLNKQINFIVEEWEHGPKITLKTKPMLTMGASKKDAKITIIEFADYLCPHCKHADPQIKAFVLANSSNTRLEFYPFPLDSQCNIAMKFSRGGLTCKLTKAVFCANNQGAGWDVHRLIFDNQDYLSKSYNKSQFFLDIQKVSTKLNFNKWKACFNDSKTVEHIFEISQAGQTAQIQGTPSFLVNNRKLSKAQFLPILNAVKSKILENQH
ncbi:MAG: thioredoxin domain-containing protein [Bdellovibrionales bacterium]|nr:thioredoxin domain-containing protein [Bdellovibrionales bacterium]